MATAEGVLSGKVAVVTGGSRGIGFSIARAFLREGAAGVTITASTARAELDNAAMRLGERAMAAVADVTDRFACASVIEATCARFGDIDILVNNAAKGAKYVGHGTPFYEADPDGWRLIIDTNVNGPFYMARAAVPGMIRRKRGRIINVSKSADTLHDRAGSPYGTSKAALEALTLSWAEDLVGSGITVNSVAPGGQTDTQFSGPAAVTPASAGRLLPPEILDGVAVWLASDASAAFTGSRFIGRLWNSALPHEMAAKGALEPSVFRVPARASRLTKR